jgi:Amidase
VWEIAKSLDAEHKAGNVRGPLHGIPFIVKDNIATKDSMETTAGSWALLGNIVPRDAHVVAQLRQAGAVLLGKATLSEWADMRSNNYSEGYSGRGGQCRSAYNLTVNPGGSSSGSGVAVGANAIAFALGTETDGSGEYGCVINEKPRSVPVLIQYSDQSSREECHCWNKAHGRTDLESRVGFFPGLYSQYQVWMLI